MSALLDEMRKKHKTPADAARALGIDPALVADAALVTDPPVSEEQRKAMFAAAEGKSTLGIPEKVGKEFVGKDKAMKGAKDIAKVRVGDDWPKSAKDAAEKLFGKDAFDAFCAKDWDPDEAEDEDKDAKAEKKEEKAADKTKDKAMDAKGAKDKKAKDSEEDEPEEVSEGKKDVKQTEDEKDDDEKDKAMDKQAMDEAIDAGITKATKALEKSIHANYRARYEAADMVRPYIGEVNPMAFDSGDAIKVHALEKLGVKDVSDLPSKALDRILGYQHKAGARPVEHTSRGKDMAMDADTKSAALKIAPGLAKQSIGA